MTTQVNSNGLEKGLKLFLDDQNSNVSSPSLTFRNNPSSGLYFDIFDTSINLSITNSNVFKLVNTVTTKGLGLFSSGPVRATLDLGYRTDALILPSGTTEQRPSLNTIGALRFNTTSGIPECLYSTGWSGIGKDVSVSGQDYISLQVGTGSNTIVANKIGINNLKNTIEDSVNGLTTSILSFLNSPTSSNLRTSVFNSSNNTSERPTGTGSLVFSINPTISSPTLILNTTASTTSGSISWDANTPRILVGNGLSSSVFYPNVISNQGDIIVGNSSGLPTRLPLGSSGRILTSNGVTALWDVLPESGGATGGGTDKVFYENDITVTTNYTLSPLKNAVTAGPITINSGVTVTIPSGQSWSIV